MRQLPPDRRRSTRCRCPTRAAAGVLLALLALRNADADELRPFEASYNWIWNGVTVALTTLQLEQTGDTWTYSSRSEPRGIGKLMPQRPKTLSVLRVAADGVEPLSYKGHDGTSSDKRTVDVTYDWNSHRISGVYEQTPVDLPLTPGVQDDSSVQIAMMVMLLRGHTPERFELLDKNGVREYVYARDGEETIKTAIGTIATVVYHSQGKYSPRINRYWCAPERGYIPVRVQQKRGDEVQWTMEIQSLSRK